MVEKQELFENILCSLYDLGPDNDIGFSELSEKFDDKSCSQEARQEAVLEVLRDLRKKKWVKTVSGYNRIPVLCRITESGSKAFRELLAQKSNHPKGKQIETVPPKEKEQTPSGENRKNFDVFVSYNSQDKTLVTKLIQRLYEHGIKAWLDDIPAGNYVVDAIQNAIFECQCAIVILGPNGLGDWHKDELRVLIHHCKEKDKPLIPVLLPGYQEIHQEGLFITTRRYVKFEKNIDEQEPLNELIERIKGKISLTHFAPNENGVTSKPGVLRVGKYVKKEIEKEDVAHFDKQFESFSQSPLRKVNKKDYDVFVSYNSQDEAEVTHIVQKLDEKRINYWRDDEKIRPGSSVILALQEGMDHAKSAAIFIGRHGLGPWQSQEVLSFLSDYTNKKNVYVIPVLLPGVNNIPGEFRLLKNLRWVRFRHVDDENALNDLIWGITGVKPPRERNLR